MTRRTARRAVLCLLMAAGSCRTPRQSDSTQPSPADGEVTFRIVNHGRLDLVIYVVQSGARDRLGQSTASTTTPFTYAMRRFGAGHEYYLVADPVGSLTTGRSETLVAAKGQLIIWTLEDDLKRSTIEVR